MVLGVLEMRIFCCRHLEICPYYIRKWRKFHVFLCRSDRHVRCTGW